ncbi:MAG: cytochrome c oxidase subunit 3 [Chloroflexota bacterium]
MTEKHTDKKNAFQLGFSIFILLAFFTAAEFFVAISFASTFLLTMLALTKASLVLYYYMHITKLAKAEANEDRESYAYKTGTNRLGLWLFILSDSFVFGGLLVTRFSLLGTTRPELEQTLGLIVTAMLLISSYFMNRAETAIKHGDRKNFLVSLAITIILGITFLVGVVGIEWQIAPFGPGDGPEGAVFYALTGFHAFHVLTGVIFLLFVFRNGLRGVFDKDEKHWPVEAAAVYWHFIDVVWIIFYPALYLIGTLHG